MSTVALAEDLYNSLVEELLHVQIHCDQIFREYERHRNWVITVEKRLKSVQNNILTHYCIDLCDYALQPLPVYERYL